MYNYRSSLGKGFMSPRPYRLGRRRPAAQRTRARVLRAARELLTARAGAEPFSVDAVARRAGVARMTVYHQFGSRRGLLEALFDSFAAGGELPAHLAAAFQRPDPLDSLADVVAAFARFWDAGRLWIRRVRALGVLDPELGDAVEARHARRREVVRVVVERLGQRYGRPAAPGAPRRPARPRDGGRCALPLRLPAPDPTHPTLSRGGSTGAPRPKTGRTPRRRRPGNRADRAAGTRRRGGPAARRRRRRSRTTPRAIPGASRTGGTRSCGRPQPGAPRRRR